MSINIQIEILASTLCYTEPMGHSKASKAETHTRLVAAAAARFKERGIDGISLADLMKDLKLTHGGFYKHFNSRDELVTEALQLALAQSGRAMRERLFDQAKPDVPGFVDFYLDESHRSGRAAGCAVAALAGDAPRKSADVQAQFRAQIDRNLEALTVALETGAVESLKEKPLLQATAASLAWPLRSRSSVSAAKPTMTCPGRARRADRPRSTSRAKALDAGGGAVRTRVSIHWTLVMLPPFKDRGPSGCR